MVDLSTGNDYLGDPEFYEEFLDLADWIHLAPEEGIDDTWQEFIDRYREKKISFSFGKAGAALYESGLVKFSILRTPVEGVVDTTGA